MSERVPVIIVPGFYGYAQASGRTAVSPDEMLVNAWLQRVEEQTDVVYEVALPMEGILCRDLPPDPAVEALAGALAKHQDTGDLQLFAYDWRRSLVASAARLAEELVELARLTGQQGFDLVAVGPGALLVRYLAESGALEHGARLVRRIVLIAAPGRGVPVGLRLLDEAVNHGDDPAAGLRETLDRFPSALQLLPPRGTPYVFMHHRPGVRIEPFAWPEVFLHPGRGREELEALATEVVSCNETLHSRLRTAPHPSWRRTLVFASASEPTVSELHVTIGDDGLVWQQAEPSPAAGDGIVPIASALPHPSVRCFLRPGPHRTLVSDPVVQDRIVGFLTGRLA